MKKLQITRDGQNPFDDMKLAREALRKNGFDCENP